MSDSDSDLEFLLGFTGYLDLDKKINIDDKLKLINEIKLNRVENYKKYQIEYRNNNKAKYIEYQKEYHLTNKNKKEICDEDEEYIDFDKVWKLLGYSRRDSAKRLLDKYFIINVDYKIDKETPLECGDVEKLVYNEKILINFNAFKQYCLKSNTKKAKEILELLI